MAAGVADRVWELEDVAARIDAQELADIEAGMLKRVAYRKRTDAEQSGAV